MTDVVTREQAYKAMVIFLDRYYERGGGDDSPGAVLGSISFTAWNDGKPNDPAQWSDWLEAIDAAVLDQRYPAK